MRPLLSILAVLAVATSIAMSSIRPVYANNGDTACERGAHIPDCWVQLHVQDLK